MKELWSVEQLAEKWGLKPTDFILCNRREIEEGEEG